MTEGVNIILTVKKIPAADLNFSQLYPFSLWIEHEHPFNLTSSKDYYWLLHLIFTHMMHVQQE